MNGGIPPKGNGLRPYHTASGRDVQKLTVLVCCLSSTTLHLICVQTSLLSVSLMGFLVVTEILNLNQEVKILVTSPFLCVYTQGLQDLFAERFWPLLGAKCWRGPQKFQQDLGLIKKEGPKLYPFRGSEFLGTHLKVRNILIASDFRVGMSKEGITS